MAYFGKEFIMDRQENFEEFVQALKVEVPPALIDNFIKFKQVTKIEKTGDGYTITTDRGNGPSAKSFKIGEEYEETTFGRTSKVVNTVDGDTFTQVQKFPDGTITVKRVFSPNELVSTTTASQWDGEAKRYYKLK